MYPYIAIAVIAAVFGLLWYLKRGKRDANPAARARDGEKRQDFEKMLAPGETLLAVCPNDWKGQYYCALTDRRFIWDGKQERVEIPISEIQKVIYRNAAASKVKSPYDVAVASIKTKKKTYGVAAVSEDSYRFYEKLWKMFPG